MTCSAPTKHDTEATALAALPMGQTEIGLANPVNGRAAPISTFGCRPWLCRVGGRRTRKAARQAEVLQLGNSSGDTVLFNAGGTVADRVSLGTNDTANEGWTTTFSLPSRMFS
jgi:hypothetical protein